MTESTQTGAGGLIRDVTDRDFEREVEKSTRPAVVVVVSADCPHCRTIMPALEALASEFVAKVKFVSLDAGTSTWTAERYGVRATPTLVFFCRGRPVQALVGALPPAAIRQAVDEFLVRGDGCIRSSTEIDYEVTGYG